jgi:cell division protein FtsB
MFKTILKYLKNKYVIVTLAFVVWILFFDKNNLISQFRLAKKLDEVQHEKDYYLNEIKETEQTIEELTSDTQNLEKYAREKYLMKKENEDIYIIVEEEEE